MATLTSRRALSGAIVLAILGLGATAVGIALDPDRALLGYLAAYSVVASTAIGALVFLLIAYATNARWLAAVRRVHEAISLVFPLLAILFIPIAIGVRRIYLWADPPPNLSQHSRELLAAKHAWLNDTGFIIRGFIYLAVFIIASEVLRRWSRRRDNVEPAGDAEDVLHRDRVFASAMLPPVALALTFAAIDWLQSLQPEWVSSMFPVYFFAAGFSAGIAILSIAAAQVRVPLSLTPNHFHALGRMLFAFCVFWAYASYFQGFLIQIANRPGEVAFFVPRLRDGWDVVLVAIVLARFALPFFLLLPRSWKYRPRFVASMAGIVFVGHVLDMFWLVLPSAQAALSWVDIAALVGMLGACVAFAAWRLGRAALVAEGDPFLPAALRYESPT